MAIISDFRFLWNGRYDLSSPVGQFAMGTVCEASGVPWVCPVPGFEVTYRQTRQPYPEGAPTPFCIPFIQSPAFVICTQINTCSPLGATTCFTDPRMPNLPGPVQFVCESSGWQPVGPCPGATAFILIRSDYPITYSFPNGLSSTTVSNMLSILNPAKIANAEEPLEEQNPATAVGFVIGLALVAGGLYWLSKKS